MIFTLNNHEYETKPIDFKAMVKLEQMGFDMDSIGQKTMSSISILVAYHIDKSTNKAIELIQEHLDNGGDIDELAKVLEDFGNSDFFQQMQK